ncbi:hypothetical protein DM793_18685 [Paenarthrobacter nitroguajacolicus]|uniref:hypothetical protein n=1 Tax=Paenarthrobacter nitroguajacolicus TaxID=211146 RepID=UPI0015C177A7|nr:hypothetical protein [Paenarthrobacter nitroguajacolicus]NWL13295.1 hypothetical protein [Paenarthrobacter nitroguajacolicus]
MGPLDKGGLLTPGKVYMAPAGTEAVLTHDQWQEVGYVDENPFSEWGDSLTDTIRTRPPVIGTTLTFACIPPKTRREKRERLAGLRLLFGHWPTHFPPRRQLIHNGRKP